VSKVALPVNSLASPLKVCKWHPDEGEAAPLGIQRKSLARGEDRKVGDGQQSEQGEERRRFMDGNGRRWA